MLYPDYLLMTTICFIEVLFSQQTYKPLELTVFQPLFMSEASFSEILLRCSVEPHCTSISLYKSLVNTRTIAQTVRLQSDSPKEIMQSVT